jgi:hypothetical protein
VLDEPLQRHPPQERIRLVELGTDAWEVDSVVAGVEER